MTKEGLLWTTAPFLPHLLLLWNVRCLLECIVSNLIAVMGDQRTGLRRVPRVFCSNCIWGHSEMIPKVLGGQLLMLTCGVSMNMQNTVMFNFQT